MRTKNLLLAAMAFVGAQAVSTASAQSWEFDPRLQLGYQFNDNYRLDFPGNEIEVSGGLLDARLPVRLATPTRNVELSPRVRKLADEVTAGKSGVTEQARAIYDHLLATMTYDKVDLPDPFGPMMAATSPWFTVRSRPLRIRKTRHTTYAVRLFPSMNA